MTTKRPDAIVTDLDGSLLGIPGVKLNRSSSHRSSYFAMRSAPGER